jgi:hypothetical protein
LAREAYLSREIPPPPPFTFVTVICVALLVECVRYRLHPEVFHLVQYPRLLIVGCFFATVAYHVWNVPYGLSKAAASSFFTQASMPSVALIVWTLGKAIFDALVKALTGLTSIAG